MTQHNDLQIDVQRSEAALVVVPRGEIDLSRSPVLRSELTRLVGEAPGKVIIDLSGVSYMDSSGVATLVESLQQCRAADVTLILCSLQERVRSIFEIARLDMVFTITDTLDEAMEA